MLQPETSNSAENVGVARSADEHERLLRMYEQMLEIRVFEEHVNELYLSAKMPM